jgi:DNA polymerase elongation subunit (family B)
MTAFDPLLYGGNPLPRVLAVEPDGDARTVTIFQRSSAGGIDEHTAAFVPWLLTSEERKIDGASVSLLAGEGYNFRIDFHKSGWRGFLEARRVLRDDNSPTMSYGSQSRQFLSASGITLFKDMTFTDLIRMQIDIETTTLSPGDPKARILLIAISDNAGHIEVLEDDETEMLEELGDRIRRWNPDVIEGHNIYSFDLPYIMERCKTLGVTFDVGRRVDSAPTIGNPRNCAIGSMSRPFTPIYIYGRHIIDTYLQVQRFDASRGEISSYGLKECAKVYNISSDDRLVLDRSRIEEELRSAPESVKKYARQDVEETRALAALVSPTEFYQSQMTPDTYQSVAVMGSGEKVNSLLVREYLRSNCAIPFSSASTGYPGGYTEVRRVGVIHRVVKADVESLYPSLILTRKIHPQTDTLGVFLPLLSDLTLRRLDAKAKVKNFTKGTTDYAYWDGLQNSFKILINSFYGYIGGPFYFNDYAAAKSVTVAGQQIVKSIADELEREGSSVIEIDTDGIYFQPPPSVDTPAMEEEYINQVSSVVPAGIRLAHDGRYAAMLSLKIKNYVLVEYDGRKILKGSSLRSRADEAFGREFITRAVDLLLADDFDQMAKLYAQTLDAIQQGKIPIEQISRRERITSTVRDTPQRRGINALISSGAIVTGDIVHIYNRNDGTLELKADYNNDEDRDHYSSKLYKFASRLSDAFTDQQFAQLFPKPKPTAQRLQERLQSSFDF